MENPHYHAACTEGECLLVCSHEHQTVIAATACISWAGGYVVGVENRTIRVLTDEEEAEFQSAMHGCNAGHKPDPFGLGLLVKLGPQSF
jgi:hypothetical protein